ILITHYYMGRGGTAPGNYISRRGGATTLAIKVPATSATAVKTILNVVSTPETIFSSINAARPRKPTLPGTSSIMPGTSVMIAGRSSNRAYQLLATPTVNAPRNTPISGPKNLTPRRLPPTANAP